jgi:AcrR family transcriptional regulator
VVKERRMSDGTTVDPRVERSRAAVTEAAIDLLLEGGIAAVTIDAVSQRSGVARTTIYRHWDGREALLVDIFRSIHRELEPPPTHLPPEERVRLLVRQVAAALASATWRRALPSLFGAARRFRELSEFRRRVEGDQARVLTAVLADAVAAGALPPDTDLREAVLQLLGPLLAAALSDPESVTDGLADRVVALFFASRRSDPATRAPPPPG